MKPKVSIIVPVFNAGFRFSKCLETLAMQTLKEIEIILVLDCPTDGSDLIAREFAERDSRVRIISNKVNLNIGLTRNKGIELATGEYIGFSDHDDFRELDMYEVMYREAKENNLDILITLPTSINEDTGEKSLFPISDVNLYSRDDILDDIISWGGKDSNTSYFTYILPNIYRREFILEKGVRFVDTRDISAEDNLFQLESVYYSTNVACLNKSFYYHLLHCESEGYSYQYRLDEKRYRTMEYLHRFLVKEGIFIKNEKLFYTAVNKVFISLLIGKLQVEKDLISFFRMLSLLRRTKYTKKSFKSYEHSPNAIGFRKKSIRRVLAFLLKF